jgi:hypothetical protein
VILDAIALHSHNTPVTSNAIALSQSTHKTQMIWQDSGSHNIEGH